MNRDTKGPRAPEVLVVFRVGALRLGMDVRRVREVTRALSISAPLPNAAGVAGIVTLRGASTAVVDVGAVLDIPCERRDRRARMIAIRHNGGTVCLLVDQVDGLHGVTKADLEPAPPVLGDVDIAWLDYVTRPETGELIGVISIDRMMSRVSLAGSEKEKAGV